MWIAETQQKAAAKAETQRKKAVETQRKKAEIKQKAAAKSTATSSTPEEGSYSVTMHLKGALQAWGGVTLEEDGECV
jgi:hypothetical protein